MCLREFSQDFQTDPNIPLLISSRLGCLSSFAEVFVANGLVGQLFEPHFYHASRISVQFIGIGDVPLDADSFFR